MSIGTILLIVLVLPAHRRTTYLALQQRLGLLPQRNCRVNRIGAVDPALDGQAVVG